MNGGGGRGLARMNAGRFETGPYIRSAWGDGGRTAGNHGGLPLRMKTRRAEVRNEFYRISGAVWRADLAA